VGFNKTRLELNGLAELFLCFREPTQVSQAVAQVAVRDGVLRCKQVSVPDPRARNRVCYVLLRRQG
jgi:hypothetical protein